VIIQLDCSVFRLWNSEGCETFALLYSELQSRCRLHAHKSRRGSYAALQSQEHPCHKHIDAPHFSIASVNNESRLINLFVSICDPGCSPRRKGMIRYRGSRRLMEVGGPPVLSMGAELGALHLTEQPEPGRYPPLEIFVTVAGAPSDSRPRACRCGFA
jgi:hypothetical protein